MIPKVVDNRWQKANSKTLLDIEALLVLRDDATNYIAKKQPFVVRSDGIHYVAPKYMWKQGCDVIQHLHCFKAPDLGRATLAEWIEAILESGDPLSDIEEDVEQEAEEEEEEEEEGEEPEQTKPPAQTQVCDMSDVEASATCIQGPEVNTQKEIIYKYQTRKQRNTQTRFVT